MQGDRVRLIRGGVSHSVAIVDLLRATASEPAEAAPVKTGAQATAPHHETRKIAALKKAVVRLAVWERKYRESRKFQHHSARHAATHREQLYSAIRRHRLLADGLALERAELLAEIERLQGRVGEMAREAVRADAPCAACREAGTRPGMMACQDCEATAEAATLRAVVADLRAELAVYRVADGF